MELFYQMKKGFLLVAVCFVCIGQIVAQNVARIGTTEYGTLQEALNDAYAATGDVTIDILNDFTGFGVVRQKAGQILIINGNDKTINGQIILTNQNGIINTGLTIENLNFVIDLGGYTMQAGTEAVVCAPYCKNQSGADPFWQPENASSWWQQQGINI